MVYGLALGVCGINVYVCKHSLRKVQGMTVEVSLVMPAKKYLL